MRLIYHIKNFLRPSQDSNIEPQVREHFKRNFITNTIDAATWQVGDSFVSVSTILPVFASTMTDSAILIGLISALVNAGWFIPQFFMASHVKSLKRMMPFARAMAIMERIPYLILPLSALALHWISKDIAIWIFMFVIAWRGFASGLVALPWQEVIAKIIPSSIRSRFFGISRMLGTIGAVIGSTFAGIILSKFAYPDNYAISFMFAAVFTWTSYFFFSRTIEPEKNSNPNEIEVKQPKIDLKAYREILRTDKNYTRYVFSRIFFQLGSMATGFLAVYGIQNFSLSDEYSAVFSGILFTCNALGNVFWSIVGDKAGPRNTLLISDILQAFVMVLSFLAGSVWTFYLVFMLYGFAQAGFIIGELILGMEIGKEEDRPMYIGLARSISGIFILIAPVIGGLLVEWVGYRVMFLVALVFYVVAVIYVFQVHEREESYS